MEPENPKTTIDFTVTVSLRRSNRQPAQAPRDSPVTATATN